MGFGGVILHGLSSYGFAARGLIQAIANGNSRALTVFGARFTSPVKPGDELETSAWEVGPGPNGTSEITFITKNLTSGKVRYLSFYFLFVLNSWRRLHWAMVLPLSKRQKRASYSRELLLLC